MSGVRDTRIMRGESCAQFGPPRSPKATILLSRSANRELLRLNLPERAERTMTTATKVEDPIRRR